MRSLFRSKHRVTQAFNVNPDYYKKFGLKAHEGLDLVPTGSVWDVLCLADGVVVKDEDNALSGAYGRNVTVWHNKLRKATQYCHFKENYVTLGQIVSAGEKLGLMGSTGNTTGAHVHLNLFETDENGIRLNRDNGYLGGTDPLPFIEQETPVVVAPDLQAQLSQSNADRNRNWDWFAGLCDAMGVPAVFETAKAELVKLVGVEDTYNQMAKKLSEANTQIADLEIKLKELQSIQEKITLDNTVLTNTVNQQHKLIDSQSGEIATLSTSLQELKQGIEAPVRKGWKKALVALIDKLF